MTRFAAFLALLLLPGIALAEAPLFKAQAPGISVFLLGSVHMVEPGLPWKGATIERAFAESRECWFEVDTSEDSGIMMQQVMADGLDPAHPLSDRLSPVDRDRLRQKVEASNVPGGMAAVNVMRPWLAWLTIVAQAVAAPAPGSDDPELVPGPDFVLTDEAKKAGKTILGLETIAKQVAVLAEQDDGLMLSLLRNVLDAPKPPRTELRRLSADWAAGHLEAIGELVNALERDAAPGLADRLLRQRNSAWADRLSEGKNSGKTILVTVGAGHLVGTDNLREQLERRGWTVERVN